VLDRAPDLTLPDSKGDLVALSSLRRDCPLLLIFWRFYGCSCGIKAAEYVARHRLDCLFLVDPTEQAYQEYGLVEGTVPQVLFDMPKAFWSHQRDSVVSMQKDRRAAGIPLVDNPWLLPGEFVIDTGGRIRLAYRWQYCEDFPDPLVHLAAIELAW
jgi:hypothetical protein